MTNRNLKVAILISTMNRPDFLIRTLNYYAERQSPHPIYLGDSSNPENAGIIKTALENLKDKLEVNYQWYPPRFDNLEKQLSRVNEKYAVINGDDDYEIPNSLTKCAEFLENNPDYTSAGGYGVTFRLKTSGPYGEIKRLADYPRFSLEAETASQRLTDFMKNIFTITFSVTRVGVLRNISVGKITMISTWNELAEGCCCAIYGKSKLLDCLGFVRHIHDRQYYAYTMIDWLTAEDFHDSYVSFKKMISEKIAAMDKIPIEQAELVVKNSFWDCLQKYMADTQKDQRAAIKTPQALIDFKILRYRLGVALPVLKHIYREFIKPRYADKKQMHYEVLRLNSKYYKDFKPAMDSFTGSAPKNL